MVEEFRKTPESLLDPDPRSRRLPSERWNKGIAVPEGLEKMHQEVAHLELGQQVPERVRSAFNTARNLYAYGWFFYPLSSLAEFQAYVALEMALAERWRRENPVNKKRRAPTLKPLLRMAVDKAWIQDEGLTHVERFQQQREATLQNMPEEVRQRVIAEEEPRPDYVEIIAENTPYLRNFSAHEFGFWWPKTRTLELVRDLVVQLFPKP